MSHSPRCENAVKMPASQCQCSCNGALHPEDAGFSGSEDSISEEDVKDSAKTVGKAMVLGGVASTNPHLATAYTAYTTGKAGKRMYDAWSDSDSSDRFSNLVEETKQQGVAFQASKITEKEAGEIAEDLRNSVEDSGGLEYLADTTNDTVDEEVFGEMLEGSTKEALTTGSAEVSKTALEVA